MKLGALVIGLGQIGMGYDLELDAESHVLTHARAFRQHSRFQLLGGVDPDRQRRAMFESRYASPAYTDIETALRESRPDVVAIATPTPLHGMTLHKVLRSSKPAAILCEKPLSLVADEARRMVEACAASGVALYVNYIRRSDPGAIEVRRRLKESLISGPQKGVVWYSKGLFHNGSHFFNLIQYWLGRMREFHVISPGRLWDGVDPEPDVQVKFEDAIITFLSAKEENFSHCTIELVAANGRLRYEQGGERIIWQYATRNRILASYVELASSEEVLETGMRRSQWHVANQLAASMAGDAGAEICGGAEALETLEALSTIRSEL